MIALMIIALSVLAYGQTAEEQTIMKMERDTLDARMKDV